MGDGDRDVFKVWSIVNCGCRAARRIEPLRKPRAYVLQSEDGAKAVIGSLIVRAEICSLLDGSNKMTSPFSLPDMVNEISPIIERGLTKCNVSIPHPRCHEYRLVGGKPRDLLACKQIPDDSGLAYIVGDHQPSLTSFTDIVHRDQGNRLRVTLKPASKAKCVVMENEYGRTLREEEM